jgi:glucose/arabinose dehydrogenase
VKTLAVVVLLLLPLTACSDTDKDAEPGEGGVTAQPSPQTPGEPTTTDGSGAPAKAPTVVDTIATGLRVPWGLAFLPDGTAIVTERDSGRVLAIKDKQVTEIGQVDEAAPAGEAGLLGVAVSPDFASDRLVYLYVTTEEDNRIVRAPYEGGELGDLEVILDGIPNGFIHDGGRLEFGPDGSLYASTGETGEPELAQDRDSLGGKVLRVTPDGEPAPGNPDPDSPVFSWGHRNIQGLAFDDGGRLWASEFGADLFDELNLIEKGRNYGWPLVEGNGGDSAYVNPQVVWDTSEASPSGLAYENDTLWLASLRGERLWRIDISGRKAAKPADFFVGEYGRLRTVAVAPDGNLWLTTSNHDGRGNPAGEDDRILVVRP